MIGTSNAQAGARQVLESFSRTAGRRVHVACDLTVNSPDEPRLARDLLAVRNAEPHERMKCLVSAEGNGLDLVMEVHVAGDRRKDVETNAGATPSWASRSDSSTTAASAACTATGSRDPGRASMSP